MRDQPMATALDGRSDLVPPAAGWTPWMWSSTCCASTASANLPRKAVVGVLLEARHPEEHLSAEEIACRAVSAAPTLHLATVYSTVYALMEFGLVSQSEVGGPAAVFLLAAELGLPEPSRAHIRCLICGRVQDLPDASRAVLDGEWNRVLAFEVAPAHSVIGGRCVLCREPVADAGGVADSGD